MLSPVNQNTSPSTHLLRVMPDFSFLHTFGCACWPSLRKYNSRKLEFCSELCVFFGYSPMHKGYKCLDRVHLDAFTFLVMWCLMELSLRLHTPVHLLISLKLPHQHLFQLMNRLPRVPKIRIMTCLCYQLILLVQMSRLCRFLPRSTYRAAPRSSPMLGRPTRPMLGRPTRRMLGLSSRHKLESHMTRLHRPGVTGRLLPG